MNSLNLLQERYDFSRLENMWVRLVSEIIVEMLEKEALCDCSECVLDILAISLNRLPTRYWVSGEFNAFTTPDSFLADPANRQKAMDAVLAANELVRSNPHH